MSILKTEQKRGLEDLINGFEDIGTGVANISKGVYKIQKPVSNWSMDKALRVVSGAGYFLGVNALALTAVHFGYNDLVEPMMQEVFGSAGYNNFKDYMDNHLVLKNALATSAYLPVLNFVNFGKVVPDFLKKKSSKNDTGKKSQDTVEEPGPVKRFIKKYSAVPNALRLVGEKRKPNLLNYAKLTLYSGLILASATFGGGMNMASRTYDDFTTKDSFIEKVEAVRDNLFLFGKQGNHILEKGAIKTQDFYANISSIIYDMGKDKKQLTNEQTKKIEDSLEIAKKTNPDFDYDNDNLFKKLEPLIERGLFKTPELAIHTSRLVYFEAMRYSGDHEKLSDKQKKQTLHAMEDVVSCIYNRWKFDNWKEEENGIRPFSQGKGQSLEDIAFKHSGNVWQFTAVRDQPKYFHNNKNKFGWDIYKGGKLNVAAGHMDKDRAELAMESLINVLNHEVKDRTKQATFYQNPKYVDSKNKDWKKRYGLDKTGYSAFEHVFWKYPNQPNLVDYEESNNVSLAKGNDKDSNVYSINKQPVSNDKDSIDCYNLEDKGKYLKIRLNGECSQTAGELGKQIFAKYSKKSELGLLKEHKGNYEYEILPDDMNLLGYRTLFMSKR